jgi:hypothetical protein
MKSKKGSTVYKLEEVDYKDSCIDIEFDVSYIYDPPEEMVRYYSDGSGYPGAPEQLELYDIKCTKVYFEDHEVENPTEPLSGEMYDLFINNEEIIKERILQDIYDSYIDDLADKYERYE